MPLPRSNDLNYLMLPATPAKDLAITEIMDCDTGEILKVREYISGHRYQDIFAPRQESRSRWTSENPKFRCPFCLVPVSLLGRLEKHWFFRHLYEDGNCTAKTRGKLNQDQIKAIKYRAQRESAAHIKFKEMLAHCIEADGRFLPPTVEGRWGSTEDKSKWRKPDVRSKFDAIDLAFEVQLSTTFLDVVLARQSFYRAEKAGLIWLLPHFEPGNSRMMEEDIFLSNNLNVFVLDEETVALSRSRESLHFRCWYRRPFEAELELRAEWVSEIVDFSNIVIDVEKQSVYYFDYHSAEAAEQLKIEEKVRENSAREDARAHERMLQKDEEVRGAFERFWFAASKYDDVDEDELQWMALQLTARGIELPKHLLFPKEVIALLNGIYSAKNGQSVGWNFPDLVNVGHHLADLYPMLLPLFGFACKVYDTNTQLNEQDHTGKFRTKVADTSKKYAENMMVFLPSGYAKELCDFLFPQASDKLEKWVLRSVAEQQDLIKS